MKPKIGFVGIGIMGYGMAESLLRADYEVTVYNRTREKAEELAKMGAKVADSPAMAAMGNEVVFTMLADPPAIRDAVLGPSGVIEGMESGAVLIDCSTVDPETTAETLRAASAKGVGFLDAPVGGSKDAAVKGELLMLVGGEPEVLEQVREVLEVVGERIVHAGPSGSGTMLKLCFNLAVSHMAAVLAEALVLGVSGGLKPQTVIDAYMAGVVAAPIYRWKGERIMQRDFSTNFSTKLMYKDLGLIMSAGNDLKAPLPVTAAVKELFTMAIGSGLAEEDFCSVIKVLEEFTGVEVRK